ncbi:MAG: hypothetical protein A2289_21625 [Deltaproteobacteria bacterium RIFOXYA12_FULL_58_15]|nr:MAG: hypothetical protein A2289_21625 [Deltaproteobacteria bacterium RIFOXYA12_FULL_58_15]OGR15011.1 MAG: hypothetical protein A2341_17890 [Deltaproteobacteria bacterium RIFOXYB12_FULL_58_9]
MPNVSQLPTTIAGDAVRPDFLNHSDTPWIALLLEEVQRFEGKPRKLLDEHLRGGLPFAAPSSKLLLAQQTIRRLWRFDIEAAIAPHKARTRLFTAAAEHGRDGALERVADELRVTPKDLEASLFADLPRERRVHAPKEPLSPSELSARANLILVQAMLKQSTGVRVRLQGNARPVVRHAKFRGLICNVMFDKASNAAQMEISGPLSLFQRTLVYGRALAELLPPLSWCNRFYLEADIVLGSESKQLILATGAPIFPGKEPKRFDSRLEERFAREFGQITADWDLIREPEPIPVGRSLIFPDFSLVRRGPPYDRWFLEIVGFWTPEYLEHKIATLHQAGLERLIICIDKTKNCSDNELPARARVIRFAKKVDVEEVLAIIDPACVI